MLSTDSRINSYGDKDESYPNTLIIKEDKCQSYRTENFILETKNQVFDYWYKNSTNSLLKSSAKNIPFRLLNFAIPHKKTFRSLKLGEIFDGNLRKAISGEIVFPADMKTKNFLKGLAEKNSIGPIKMSIEIPYQNLEKFIYDQEFERMPTLDGTPKSLTIELPQIDGTQHKIVSVVRDWNIEVSISHDSLSFETDGISKSITGIFYFPASKIVHTYDLEITSFQ